MEKLKRWTRWAVVCLICAGAATVSPAFAQVTFTTLANFDGTNGAGPVYVSLVQGLDGNFYGTTSAGGANQVCNGSCGTVFKVTPGGTVTVLHSFDNTDGSMPYAGLTLGTDGNFYGTTLHGGKGGGTVFKITPAVTLTVLHSFNGTTDGADPTAALVQGTDGNFYGTASACIGNCSGTVFKITPTGTLTTLYVFCSGGGQNCPDGLQPQAPLVQGTDGNFYGTTDLGGTFNSSLCASNGHGCGTVFKITPGGKLTTLHSFDGTDGGFPHGGLVQGTDGNFYGTTDSAGANGGGTIFKITPAGKLTTLYNFCAPSSSSCTNGGGPTAGLLQATDGNFYGPATFGGSQACVNSGCGTLFEFTPSGTFTLLHSFDLTDGLQPSGGLVQGTDGSFYGLTAGGTNNDGTVFKLSVGLGPFVETLSKFGKVGAAVQILGTNLTGATGVSFNGTTATFTVVSASEISTTVPSGATTGTVQVTTPNGTLSSNAPFRVVPVISSFSPSSGPDGTTVTITGEALTGATSVTFGGVKATSFTVNSYTQVTATVPAGAKTGKIGVTTPGGTALSASTFTVN